MNVGPLRSLVVGAGFVKRRGMRRKISQGGVFQRERISDPNREIEPENSFFKGKKLQ